MTIFNIIYYLRLGRKHNVSGYSFYHFIYMYSIDFCFKAFSAQYKQPYLGAIVCSIFTFTFP